jgi:hypothetical protein
MNLGTYANIFLFVLKTQRKKVQAILKWIRKKILREKKKNSFFFCSFTASTVSVYNASKNALSHPNF